MRTAVLMTQLQNELEAGRKPVLHIRGWTEPLQVREVSNWDTETILCINGKKKYFVATDAVTVLETTMPGQPGDAERGVKVASRLLGV